MWRIFEPHVEAHSAIAKTEPISTEPFQIIGPLLEGGSSSVRVRLESGLEPYAKPAHPRTGDVARERIAFLLGHRLGLPVATVQISRETVGLPLILPPIVALSFPMLGRARPWEQMAISPVDRASLRRIFTAMHVFHCWIDDHDHFCGSNVEAERMQDGSIRMAFFDYGHSLTREWRPPCPAVMRSQWRSPPMPFSSRDPQVLDLLIDQIRKLTVDELQYIIGSVPADCITADERTDLAAGLFERGQQLREVLR